MLSSLFSFSAVPAARNKTGVEKEVIRSIVGKWMIVCISLVIVRILTFINDEQNAISSTR